MTAEARYSFAKSYKTFTVAGGMKQKWGVYDNVAKTFVENGLTRDQARRYSEQRNAGDRFRAAVAAKVQQ